MKKSNRSIRREGFTLVELLIVIVVIGILSAMMMLSSTEAVSSARASNIISNLRNLKTAALAYYTDNLDNPGNIGDTATRTKILKYMSNESVDAKYKFVGDGADNKWFVYYENSDAKVGEKLKGRKSSVGLWEVTGGASADYGGAANETVGMFIR